jgi:hypothetical protein
VIGGIAPALARITRIEVSHDGVARWPPESTRLSGGGGTV